MAGTITLAKLHLNSLYGVSMESGLDGRNNEPPTARSASMYLGLNGVRPRWPEQLIPFSSSVTV